MSRFADARMVASNGRPPKSGMARLGHRRQVSPWWLDQAKRNACPAATPRHRRRPTHAEPDPAGRSARHHPAHWLHMPDLHDLDRRGDRPGHVPLHEASERADADQPEQLTRQPGEFDHPSVRTGAADARKAAQLCGRLSGRRDPVHVPELRPQHVQNPPDRRRQRSRLAGHVGKLRHHDGASAPRPAGGAPIPGYEPAFKRAVLARYDAIALPPPPDAVTTLPQRDTRRLALVG